MWIPKRLETFQPILIIRWKLWIDSQSLSTNHILAIFFYQSNRNIATERNNVCYYWVFTRKPAAQNDRLHQRTKEARMKGQAVKYMFIYMYMLGIFCCMDISFAREIHTYVNYSTVYMIPGIMNLVTLFWTFSFQFNLSVQRS